MNIVLRASVWIVTLSVYLYSIVAQSPVYSAVILTAGSPDSAFAAFHVIMAWIFFAVPVLVLSIFIGGVIPSLREEDDERQLYSKIVAGLMIVGHLAALAIWVSFWVPGTKYAACPGYIHMLAWIILPIVMFIPADKARLFPILLICVPISLPGYCWGGDKRSSDRDGGMWFSFKQFTQMFTPKNNYEPKTRSIETPKFESIKFDVKIPDSVNKDFPSMVKNSLNIPIEPRSENSWGVKVIEDTQVDIPGGGQLEFKKDTDLVITNVGGTSFEVMPSKPVTVTYGEWSAEMISAKVDAAYDRGVKVNEINMQNRFLEEIIKGVTRNYVKM